jgi:hypothetical protein
VIEVRVSVDLKKSVENQQDTCLEGNEERYKERVGRDVEQKTHDTRAGLKECSVVLVEHLILEVLFDSENVCVAVPFWKKLVEMKMESVE